MKDENDRGEVEGGEPIWQIAEEPRDLRQRTKQFSLRIIRMFSALPSSTSAQIMGKQVLRSGTSAGANYREVFRSRSDQEFVAKLGDCFKDLDETSYRLELLKESDIVPGEKLSSLQSEVNELLAIFTTISKSQKRKLYG